MHYIKSLLLILLFITISFNLYANTDSNAKTDAENIQEHTQLLTKCHIFTDFNRLDSYTKELLHKHFSGQTLTESEMNQLHQYTDNSIINNLAPQIYNQSKIMSANEQYLDLTEDSVIITDNFLRDFIIHYTTSSTESIDFYSTIIIGDQCVLENLTLPQLSFNYCTFLLTSRNPKYPPESYYFDTLNCIIKNDLIFKSFTMSSAFKIFIENTNIYGDLYISSSDYPTDSKHDSSLEILNSTINGNLAIKNIGDPRSFKNGNQFQRMVINIASIYIDLYQSYKSIPFYCNLLNSTVGSSIILDKISIFSREANTLNIYNAKCRNISISHSYFLNFHLIPYSIAPYCIDVILKHTHKFDIIYAIKNNLIRATDLLLPQNTQRPSTTSSNNQKQILAALSQTFNKLSPNLLPLSISPTISFNLISESQEILAKTSNNVINYTRNFIYKYEKTFNAKYGFQYTAIDICNLNITNNFTVTNSLITGYNQAFSAQELSAKFINFATSIFLTSTHTNSPSTTFEHSNINFFVIGSSIINGLSLDNSSFSQRLSLYDSIFSTRNPNIDSSLDLSNNTLGSVSIEKSIIESQKTAARFSNNTINNSININNHSKFTALNQLLKTLSF